MSLSALSLSPSLAPAPAPGSGGGRPVSPLARRPLRSLQPLRALPPVAPLCPLSDDEVNDIACRSEVAREMRLGAEGAHAPYAAALRGAADALTSSDDRAARVYLDVLPLHCGARRLFVAFCVAIADRDWCTVTEALDAWERSGEMDAAMAVLSGDGR
jgi:hypothetical protein